MLRAVLFNNRNAVKLALKAGFKAVDLSSAQNRLFGLFLFGKANLALLFCKLVYSFNLLFSNHIIYLFVYNFFKPRFVYKHVNRNSENIAGYNLTYKYA